MIENESKDRRYKRTKYVIRRAFEELISEKDVNDITITEIVSVANINRKTFYAHYDGIYKLIEEIENTTPSFKNSAKDFNRMYLDIVDSLNQKEVNYNEYEPFFKYINQIFPQYQESLVKSIGNLKNIGIGNSELDQAIADLDNAIMEIVNTFTNLLKIAIDYVDSTKDI